MVREFRRVKIRVDDIQGTGEFGSAGARSSTRTIRVRQRGVFQVDSVDCALMTAVLGRPFPTKQEEEEWWV